MIRVEFNGVSSVGNGTTTDGEAGGAVTTTGVGVVAATFAASALLSPPPPPPQAPSNTAQHNPLKRIPIVDLLRRDFIIFLIDYKVRFGAEGIRSMRLADLSNTSMD